MARRSRLVGHFDQKMRMTGALFAWGMLVRLSPDSARTKNTTANIIPSQKIGRAAAFNLFIVLLLLLARQRSGSFTLNRS